MFALGLQLPQSVAPVCVPAPGGADTRI